MGSKKQGPLSNITVLDFTWVLAGPHATKTFTDMGANVLKVERYKDGTNERHQALQVEKNGVTQSSYHINENRGKKSLCINLKNPKGIDVIYDLIKKCDIIIENFAPGVMDRLKLDYESVKKIKPDIIYCSISAYGHWGPDSKKTGYDIISQAASGWIGLYEQPNAAPVAIGDTVTAMHACTAILAALHHRSETGEGQNIDVSLMDCMFSINDWAFTCYWISEAVGKEFIPPLIKNAKSNTSAPYGVYKGKNGVISIASMMDKGWSELVDLMGPGNEWLKTDPRTRDTASRCKPGNSTLVHEALESWVMTQDSVEEAERKLNAIGIAACHAKSVKELATTDPQLAAREMRVRYYQPFLGEMTMFGSPLKFSKTPAAIRGYAPFLGEHNREVLSGMLDYSQDKIEELYREDALYQAPEVDRLPEELKNRTEDQK